MVHLSTYSVIFSRHEEREKKGTEVSGCCYFCSLRVLGVYDNIRTAIEASYLYYNNHII